MATSNSTGNLITMTAVNDTARVGIKIKVAGVIITSNSLTAAGHARLRDSSSTCDIVPLTRAKSGVGLLGDYVFVPPIEVKGLKATNCTNANIRIQLA